ncbi:unnamed protein product [Trichogramma brassicae]|uniref:Uncharacterized protein n=1 Tax=Trichogramma brassicae TaxID=86971 RepID=A0A6H5IEX8_9HYME|nr:unnamed protein product [Trichogramma brassicae]
MFASTCVDVPMLIDAPMRIDEQPRKRNMSASSVESALLEPKKQKRLEDHGIQAQQSREALYAYMQSRPAFKSDYAPQQDRRSFNNCIRPTPTTFYELPSSTPVEFIQHRDKRFKRMPMPCENVAKRSNKIEDAWERMEQDRANLMAFREGHGWSTQ